MKERLLIFLKHLGMSQGAFEKKVCLSNGFVNNIGDSIRKISYEKISAAYPELNINWLKTGEGEMLKSDTPETPTVESPTVMTGKIIPLYDADVAAGTAYGMEMEPSRQIGMIDIGGFLKDSESALRVYGNSMTPHYPPGCIVGTKLWQEKFIEPGKVYVIETEDNRFLKRLYYNSDKSALRCLSDNTMKHETGPAAGEYCYPEFEIPLSSVRRLHRVVGAIKRNII